MLVDPTTFLLPQQQPPEYSLALGSGLPGSPAAGGAVGLSKPWEGCQTLPMGLSTHSQALAASALGLP